MVSKAYGYAHVSFKVLEQVIKDSYIPTQLGLCNGLRRLCWYLFRFADLFGFNDIQERARKD